MEELATLRLGSSAIRFRRARSGDLPAIVDLLAADPLGAARDGVQSYAGVQAYRKAFRQIDRDPAHVLIVAESEQGTVVATMQLSYLPGLARHGALQVQIEAVRVHEAYRRCGLEGEPP